MVTTEVDGLTLDGPNDLAFGDDGRLWFTDPRGAPDPGENDEPGRLFAVEPDDRRRRADPRGRVGVPQRHRLPGRRDARVDRVVHPAGDALVDGAPELVIQLPDRHAPDGLCVGADGRLYVASTYGHCVSVVDDGEIVDRLVCGDGMPTNCCFGGTDLYVTESRRGTLWRFALGVEGLPLR